ncbi:MAG: cytochrome C oxidase subunit IV family protein [Akkermansiaceae bacterium]|jgi:caa(3)-type oxidase subunit IV
MADSPEEINKKKKLYLVIMGLLFIFTVVTVLVATVEPLDFGGHGFDHVDATIGLCIAAFKATLVMLIFMHLNHEKKLIYFFYGLGLVMAFFCMALIGWAKYDPIRYGSWEHADGFYNPEKPTTKPHH